MHYARKTGRSSDLVRLSIRGLERETNQVAHPGPLPNQLRRNDHAQIRN